MPLVSLLTQQQSHAASLALAGLVAEMRANDIDPEPYLVRGRGEALRALVERSQLADCRALLESLSKAAGAAVASRAFVAGLEKLAAQGSVRECEALFGLVPNGALLSGKSLVTFADGLSHVRISWVTNLLFAIAYSSILQDTSQADKVLQLYQQALQKAPLEEEDYAVLMRAFGRLGDRTQVQQLLDAMPLRGLTVRAACFAPLLSYFCKEKNRSGFEWVLAEMRKRNVKRNIAILRIQMALLVSLVWIFL